MHPQSTSAPKRAPHPIARSMPEADRITEAIREPYGYVRVSTILQRLKGYSLPKQLKAVAASAVADENPIALENRVCRTASATTRPPKRARTAAGRSTPTARSGCASSSR